MVHAGRISIHAPREGGDVPRAFLPSGRSHFNPRPREGGDAALRHSNTPPYYISIHAPREGGDAGGPSVMESYLISIHAPHEGGDQKYNK